MLSLLENMINRWFDRDWVWWPLLPLRPPKHKCLSWRRVTLLFAIDVVLAVGMIYTIVAFFVTFEPIPFAIYLQLLSSLLGDSPILTLSALFALAAFTARGLMVFAWNRRARRFDHASE